MRQEKRKFINMRMSFFGLVLCVFFFCSCEKINESKLKSSDNFEACVQSYIKKWEYKPALEISIYGNEGTINYQYKGGYASISNNIKVDENSLFILYSITKSMTAFAIIDLVNKGKLMLDDKLGNFIQNLNPIYINEDATIEELLTHRSGIQDYTDNPALIYNNPFMNRNDWNPLILLDYISYPGERRGNFIYSSTNYVLLGMIIEKITGDLLCDYFQKVIFDKYNVNMMLYPENKININNIVNPHVYPNTFMGLYGDGITPIDISTLIKDINELTIKCSWAAGGVVSDAKNTSIWGYELLSEKGRIDSSIRNKILDSVSQFSSKTNLSDAYGYGIRKIEYSGYIFFGSYGRSYGSENLMFYNKDKDICIVILSSSNTKSNGNPNIDELMFSLFEVL